MPELAMHPIRCLLIRYHMTLCTISACCRALCRGSWTTLPASRGCKASSQQCFMQEHRFGSERVKLVKLLQQHGVVVKGGPEGGQKLLEALLVCPIL